MQRILHKKCLHISMSFKLFFVGSGNVYLSSVTMWCLCDWSAAAFSQWHGELFAVVVTRYCVGSLVANSS